MNKKYQVIYADPPWEYGSRGARGGKFGELDYSSMTIPELCSMDVKSIADDTAHLYMWVTSPFLEDCRSVAKAWGFRFIRCEKVWGKTKESGARHGVCGPHGMSDCEFLMMYARGNRTTSLYNSAKRNQYQLEKAPYTGTHSNKPDIFRDMINQKYPLRGINKLEMFARYSVEGWDVFGNEAPDSILIPTRDY